MAETNANDPAGLLPPPGASTNPSIIKIVNTARMDLNDSRGIVQSYNTDRSEYLVTLISNENTSSPNNQVAISLKPENLQKVSIFEKDVYLLLTGMGELFRHYTNAQSRLGFKPEYLLYGFIVLFFIFVRLFGFSRVIMGTSFTLLVAGVSAPDWCVGRCDFKTTIIKFPGRWRDAIVEASGFQNISTKMALGVFIALTLFTGKVLMFTPSPPPTSKPKSNMGMGTIMSLFTLFRMLKEMATDPHGQISFPLLVANIKMADYWKLGILGLCAYKIYKL